jgi:hypothetical protein
MPRNNRELSQFASFIEVNDSNNKIGIITDLSFSSGLGVGNNLTSYLDRIENYGDEEESLIVFNKAHFLDDVEIDGNLSIGSTGIIEISGDTTFNNLNVTGILSTVNGGSIRVNTPIDVGIPNLYGISTSYLLPEEKFVRFFNPVIFYGEFTQFKGEGVIFDVGVTTFFTTTEFDRGAIFSGPTGYAATFNTKILVTSESLAFGEPNGIGTLNTFAVDVDGGISASQFMQVGSGLTVWDYISIGGSATNESYFLSTTRFKSSLVSIGLTNNPSVLELYSKVANDILPENNFIGIGTPLDPWGFGYFDIIKSDTNIETQDLQVLGDADFTNAADFIGGLNASGVSTVTDLFVSADAFIQRHLLVTGFATFTSPAPINGVARTSIQANNIDIKSANLNEFYYPTLSNSAGIQTVLGGELFVNSGIYYNPISSDFYVGGNLNVLGDSIIADIGEPDLKFFILNTPKAIEGFLAADQILLGGQASTGVATIRNERFDVNTLRVVGNNIQASTGNTNITLDDNTNTRFYGNIEFDGNTIKTNRDTAFIFDQTVQYANLLGDAVNVDIGSQGVGIVSLRNNRADIYGDLLLKTDQILASDGAVSIQLDSNRKVTIQGDLVINGNDIISGGGVTNITLVNDQFTIFAGDIQVNGNEIRASDGNVNILMNSNVLTSVTGNLRIEGDNILAGTGATNITLLDGQQTIFAGDIRVNGNSIRASNGFVNIEMEDDIKTIFSGDIQVNGDDIRAADGTICITLEAPSGNVAIGSDLTANSVFFNGNTAVFNNDNVSIKDNLINIGLLEDPNNLGTLIGPNTTTNYDAGILLNYYSVGLNTSKKGGVIWDNSAERIAIATDVRELSPNIATIDGYATLEAKGLVINSVSGVRNLLEDDGTYLQLKRVVIDAGTY